MISVSGFVMVISRYIADKIYIGDISDILSSLVGVLSINLVLGSLIAGIFFMNSSLNFIFKLLSYMFFIELSVIYILIAYISALKDYMKIVKGFIIGTFISILSSIILILIGLEITTSIQLGLVIGFLITTVLLSIAISSFFNIMNINIFKFIPYIFNMPQLFFINLFYTLGLFSHNFIFWKFSEISSELNSTFILSTTYDNASFFAVLTILPATVLFIIKVETAFYSKYRKFISSLDGGGSLRDIEISKKEMIDVLRRELINIMKVQLVLTFLLIIFGTTILLPLLNNDRSTIEIFSLLSIGYFMTYMTFIIITILLYFDNQNDALKISIIFLVSNITLSYITIVLGRMYYGLGLPLSSLISLIIGLNLLNKMLNNIDYRLYSKQSPFRKTKLYKNKFLKRSDNSE